MARTDSDAVEAILGDDYGPLADGTTPNLSPRIEMASSVVDRLVSVASDEGTTISSAQAELIERALAAHFYTKSDPTYASRQTLRAGGVFVRNPKCPEPYRDMAISLDPSGILAALLDGRIAGFSWLGKAPSDQIDYVDRD